jgi:complement component 1 Q subcomponent-binding protein
MVGIVRVQLISSKVNDELAAKLESELSLEKEMRDPDAIPGHLKEYLDNSPFKIEDINGKEEVVLTRSFGDEK